MASDQQERDGPVVSEGRPAPRRQINALGIGLIVLALLLIVLLAVLWPADVAADAKGSAPQAIGLFGIDIVVSLDVRLMLLVMTAGALGSFVHTATSFGDFVGNQKLAASWLWWYLLKPFIGMALAVIFYMAIRGGFLTAGGSAGQVNVFGTAALAAMVGMFSKQATDKLSEVFDTLFKTSATGGDAKRKDDLKNPPPLPTALQPPTLTAGSAAREIVIQGSGFVRGASVTVNAVARDVSYRSDAELAVRLLPEDVATVGELRFIVTNPAPGGGEAPPLILRIAANTSDVSGNVDDEHADGCDVAIGEPTPDDALPPARGGVAS
jgi:hypothetical protein